ncbi:GRIP and coiled-coil domain-containing protein 1 [Anopheles nili]|uniref:GRIP and coiled-coil domain-containing protein 1 n=1 Tax=Anopheles nili TaxID=185578 RepID=UPI00237A2F5F|nr:GRIP and coiled-coil domain-containing protein 1 [Anopheles nili]
MEKKKSESVKLKEYESIISSQKEHISRYENRLKDIIVAYKGLAKEKAALEQSLQALGTGIKNASASNVQPLKESSTEHAATASEEQVQKLLNNIATITAERNRIEEISKQERNKLRQELYEKNASIEKLMDRLKSFENCAKYSNNANDSTNAVETMCHETQNKDQSLTIRELKKQLDDEQNVEEHLEQQFENSKTQLPNVPKRALVSKRSNKVINPSLSEASFVAIINLEESLKDMQKEMINLKKQHAIAVLEEKHRVRLAEENTKRLREIHEERVANFECRIRELSEVIGQYDRLREQDKKNIVSLKQMIARMESTYSVEHTDLTNDNLDRESIEDGYGTQERRIEKRVNDGSDTVIEQRVLGFPQEEIDYEHEDMHSELEKYIKRYELSLNENQKLQKDLLLNQEYIAGLKKKIDILKQSSAEIESDLLQRLSVQQASFKNETAKHSEVLNSLQATFESEIGHLQDALQKQRERSLTVMDEKDEEIKTLRTSLEILSLSAETLRQPDLISGKEKQHLLHYAQEIARKNVEISALRTSKNVSEASLRKALQDKVMSEENYKETLSQMEKEVDRLRRNHQLEGSNLEYLKNVVLSFLLSRDTESKKHMTNAIAAVLKFDADEINAVNNVKY